jgi:hypothetical protein
MEKVLIYDRRAPSFGPRRLGERWRFTCDACRVLKQAWTGEPFAYQTGRAR